MDYPSIPMFNFSQVKCKVNSHCSQFEPGHFSVRSSRVESISLSRVGQHPPLFGVSS